MSGRTPVLPDYDLNQHLKFSLTRHTGPATFHFVPAGHDAAQMEVLLMSKGGFSISAAHAGRPRRAMYLQGQRGTCV